MAAAEAKLSFDLAVDSVLDSLEPKFILKEEQTMSSSSSMLARRISVALHTSSGIIDTKSYEQTLMIDIRSAQ